MPYRRFARRIYHNGPSVERFHTQMHYNHVRHRILGDHFVELPQLFQDAFTIVEK